MRSLFLKFLSILFISLNAFSGISQVSEDVPITTLGTITNEGDGFHVPLEFCLNPDNDLVVRTNIILGGLTIMGNAQNEYGVIPANAPDMYIEYTINGVTYPPSQVGNFDLITLPNGYPAFSYIAQSPTVDFSSECANSLEDYIYGYVSFRLVTPNGEDWSTYPACNYAQSWNMFSCNVYSYAPWCESTTISGFAAGPTDPSPTCYDEWFSGGFTAKMHCDCRADDLPQEDEPYDDGGDHLIGGNDNDNIKKRFDEKTTINAYPNPMGPDLMIESNDFIKTIEIYNSRGELVLSSEFEVDNIQNVSLNTSEFPNGLYLIRVNTNSNLEVIKVLK